MYHVLPTNKQINTQMCVAHRECEWPMTHHSIVSCPQTVWEVCSFLIKHQEVMDFFWSYYFCVAFTHLYLQQLKGHSVWTDGGCLGPISSLQNTPRACPKHLLDDLQSWGNNSAFCCIKWLHFILNLFCHSAKVTSAMSLAPTSRGMSEQMIFWFVSELLENFTDRPRQHKPVLNTYLLHLKDAVQQQN